MTVSSTVNKTQADGNGSTSAFPFAFKWTASSEIEVYIDDTLKTLSTHYTLSAPGDSGTVTFLTSPTDFRPQTGEVVTIRRIQPLTQTFDPTAGGGLSSSSVEGSDDNLLMKIQQIDEQSDRAPRLKATTETGQLTFPEPVASAVIAYNAAGTDLETKGLADIGGITTPASSTDEAIVRFDGTSGLSFQNSGVTIDDSNNVAGMATLTLPNTGLHLLDTGGDHDYIITPGEDATADRTLTLNLNNADRTLSLPSPTFVNLTQTGYHDLAETSEPSSPVANVARVFARDVSTRTEVAFKRSDGTVVDLLRGLTSVKDFGAVGDGATNDTTAINAVDALDASVTAIFVPEGEYSTTLTPYQAVNKRFWGNGQIEMGGFKQARDRSMLTDDPGDPSDDRVEVFHGMPAQAQTLGYMFVGSAVGGTPGATYRTLVGAAQSLRIYDYEGGHNTDPDDHSLGRTGAAQDFQRLYHGGQGDLTGKLFFGQVYSARADATHFLANPAIIKEGGGFDATGSATGAYLNHSEYIFNDGGLAVAAIGNVRNYNRTNSDDTLNQVWIHDRPQSTGSEDADCVYSVAGLWRRGLDFTPATLNSDKAAVLLKDSDRIYFSSSSAADPLGSQWFATTLGNEYIAALSGSLTYNAGTSHLFNAQVRITSSSAFFQGLVLESTDASANQGPYFNFFRNSASPAANDELGALLWQGKDSAGNTDNFASLALTLRVATSGSEETEMQMSNYVAGSATVSLSFRNGVIVGSPTGSYKGTGTLNAVGVYDDNVLLTDYVFDKYFGVQKSEYSERVSAAAADLNAAMFCPSAYAAYFAEHHRLWGMPDLNDVIDGVVKGHSLGAMIQKLWLNAELQAIHVKQLLDRITAMEGQRDRENAA